MPYAPCCPQLITLPGDSGMQSLSEAGCSLKMGIKNAVFCSCFPSFSGVMLPLHSSTDMLQQISSLSQFCSRLTNLTSDIQAFEFKNICLETQCPLLSAQASPFPPPTCMLCSGVARGGPFSRLLLSDCSFWEFRPQAHHGIWTITFNLLIFH